VPFRWDDLRQPARPEWQPGPHRGRPRISARRFSHGHEMTKKPSRLIAGGHTFGKTHGAALSPMWGLTRSGTESRKQGLGWRCTFGTRKGADTITSGLESPWTPRHEVEQQLLP